MVFPFSKKPEVMEETIPMRYEEKKFKTIDKTYKIITFLMAIGMMYPNPRNEKKRLIIIGFLFFLYIPVYVWLIIDMIKCLRDMELETLNRQLTIGLPFFFYNVKLLQTVVKKKELMSLLNEMNEDYENYNSMSEDYQVIVEETVLKTKRIEKVWCITVGFVTSAFPITAASLMIYSYIFDEPKKYMVHESRLWGISEEKKYESPYFEIIFVYSTFIVIMLYQGFVGYVGLYCICVYHACLKFKIICIMLTHVLEDPEDLPRIKDKIKIIVNEQCKTFRFIETIQKKFEIWLALIFILTMLQMVITLYQTTNSDSIDPRYIIFVVGSVVHMYLPCNIASDITINAAEVANAAYCMGWENVLDTEFRRIVYFIIARAQRPLTIRALNMITYNMEMFISMMQTSYSIFTLLRE